MKYLMLIAACAALTTSPLYAQDVVAITGGRVMTVAGPVIEDGVVMIRNGRIEKVGKADEIEVPWEAKVIDATGKVVMPTWVLAHSQGGLRGSNENMQNVPFVSVADALDPSSVWFEQCLRNGVGSVHTLPGNDTLLGGSGMVVRPYGRTVEDMAVSTRTGIKMSLKTRNGGRLQQIRKMRRVFEDARTYLEDYERRKQEFENEKAAGVIPEDKEWEEEIDRTKKPAIDLIQKKVKGWLYVPGSAEVPEALRLAKDFDLVLVMGPRIHKAVSKLQGLDTPIVLSETMEYYETDPETDEEELIGTARMLSDAGIPFALSLGNSGPSAQAWWQLSNCVRQGTDPRTAIEALTIVPARLLGLDNQLGTLEAGKLGNVQILTGDPMQATTWVDTVVLEGDVVYERNDDSKLKFLFEEEAGKTESENGGAKE